MSLDYTCDVIFVLNYVCILNYLQHNKKRLNENLEDEMVEEQCFLERDAAVPMLYLRCNS
jgi:hypothetical protein